MALDYSDLSACAAFVSDQTGLEPDDLETLLEVSAGTKGEAIYGRPYLVAAMLLGRVAHDDLLLKAKDGVTFSNPEATIKGWLAMQGALDAALGLTIPSGFEVPSTSTTSGVPRTQSVPIVAHF